jgi:hypothetical protein
MARESYETPAKSRYGLWKTEESRNCGRGVLGSASRDVVLAYVPIIRLAALSLPEHTRLRFDELEYDARISAAWKEVAPGWDGSFDPRLYSPLIAQLWT